MKFANIKNEFEMIDIMWKKYLLCWSMGGVKGQQMAIHLPMGLQEVLSKTQCTLLVK